MRLMADDAKLLPGFAKMGHSRKWRNLVPPKTAGWAKACEIAMLGDLSAAAALDYGLINKAVPSAALMDEAPRGRKDCRQLSTCHSRDETSL